MQDCGKTFNALHGTPLAQLHRREKRLDYARALVDGVSLRMAAKRCGVDLKTSFPLAPSVPQIAAVRKMCSTVTRVPAITACRLILNQ